MKKALLILFGVAVAGGIFFTVRGLRPVAVEETATALIEPEAKVVPDDEAVVPVAVKESLFAPFAANTEKGVSPPKTSF